MPHYAVQRRMDYMLHGETRAMLRLEPGDVVQGAGVEQVAPALVASYRKAERRAVAEGHRLLFFKAYGVVRWAAAVRDLAPTRKAVTVQVQR